MYLSWNVWDNDFEKVDVVWISYDFYNDKVNNYVVLK